jgi:hypothetical protein
MNTEQEKLIEELRQKIANRHALDSDLAYLKAITSTIKQKFNQKPLTFISGSSTLSFDNISHWVKKHTPYQ